MALHNNLGPCCICKCKERVRNIVALDRKAPMPGRGWGCCVCELPSDGACAVLCDRCLEEYSKGRASLRYVCMGYPGKDGRMLIANLEGKHEHDMGIHEAYEKRLASISSFE